MKKLYFLFLLFSFFIALQSTAQTKPSKQLPDTSASEDDILKSIDSLTRLMDTTKPTSYFQVGFGVGNRLYSLNNNVLNADEGNNTTTLTPTIAYLHKSGFSFSVNSYLLSENNSFGINQYSFTPSYESSEKSTLDFSASYTYYLINNKYSVYSSPIQNDFYTSLIDKKSWVQPGAALGYSFGKFYQNTSLDTVLRDGSTKHIYDSTTNHLKSFSASLLVEHTFEWYSLFSHKDAIEFIPMISLNFGSGTISTINQTNATNILGALDGGKVVTRLLKKLKAPRVQNTELQLESPGIDLYANYTVGNFSIAPEITLDYYLPATTSDRFTKLYVVNFTYSFGKQ